MMLNATAGVRNVSIGLTFYVSRVMSRCFSRSELASACDMKISDAGYCDGGDYFFCRVHPSAHICLGEHRLFSVLTLLVILQI